MGRGFQSIITTQPHHDSGKLVTEKFFNFHDPFSV